MRCWAPTPLTTTAAYTYVDVGDGRAGPEVIDWDEAMLPGSGPKGETASPLDVENSLVKSRSNHTFDTLFIHDPISALGSIKG